MKFASALLACTSTVQAFQSSSSSILLGEYKRASPKEPLPLSAFATSKGPEQFRLAFSGSGMRISWITAADAPSTVNIGTDPNLLHTSFNGSSTSYSCNEKKCGGPYHSGMIHSAHLTPLNHGVVYYYRVAQGSISSFTMPLSAEVQARPVRLAFIGDLGQTQDSNNTVQHLIKSDPRLVLHAGDLSYADCFQPRWDSYGKLVDPLASSVPWMTVAGNHEYEDPSECGASLKHSFVSYDTRYGSLMPFREASSASTQYYSFETAGVHFLMLGSYIDHSGAGEAAKQLAWLKADLAKINRTRTPWLVGVLHAPWYNSNKAHQHEREEAELRDAMEAMLRDAHLDLMFAGHVHAYERSSNVYRGKLDKCGPAYINIGDGGNREGLSRSYLTQPDWSAFREASFGHGVLQIENATAARWMWHRDQDGNRVVSDDVWLIKNPRCA